MYFTGKVLRITSVESYRRLDGTASIIPLPFPAAQIRAIARPTPAGQCRLKSAPTSLRSAPTPRVRHRWRVGCRLAADESNDRALKIEEICYSAVSISYQ